MLFEDQPAVAWSSALQVNLTSALTMVKEAHPILIASGRGSMAFFISTYEIIGPVPEPHEGTNLDQLENQETYKWNP